MTNDQPAASPGEASVRRLGAALSASVGSAGFHWVGPGPGDGVDAIGWRLATAPRFLFSVSTCGGELPDGQFNFQVSIYDASLDRGEIVFLADVNLDELCHVVKRFARGEIIERID